MYFDGNQMGKLFQDIKNGGSAKEFSDKKPEQYGDMNKVMRIEWLLRQFNNYETYWQKDLTRFIRNARMYWHLEFGMWPEAVVEKLRKEGRRPPTFPVIPDKIETLIGSYISNGYDIKMTPDDGKLDEMTLRVMDMYLSDKNKLDWECAHIIALLDSMIGIGYERFYLTDMVDEFGNLAMEAVNPRYTLISPAWKSNYSRDLDDYFTWSMKSATEIVQKNPKHSERLLELYQRERMDGIDYGVAVGGAPRYKDADQKWMSGHKVIEFHHVERIERMNEYDCKNKNFFPETGFKMGSVEDKAVKIEYIKVMGLDPIQDIKWLKEKKTVKYIETIIPSIDMELKVKDGKDVIQPNCCNLFPVGVRYWGQNMGLVVDRLYDVQQGINKDEMNIQDILQRTAKGAVVIDAGLFGGDQRIEDEIRNNWNDPAARLVVDEGSTSRYPQGIQPLPSTAPTPEMFRNTDRYYDHADRFSKVSSAQDSRSEGNQESGKLFNMKFEASKLQQVYPKKFYERHIKSIAEGWLYAAKHSYAGIQRSFAKTDGSTFSINTPGEDTLTGRPVIINDIATLPRMKITMTPSENGMNMRLQRRNEMGEILGLVEKDPNDRLYKILFMKETLKTMEFGDDFKNEVDVASKLLMEAAALQVMSQIKQLQSQLAMADEQNKQVQEKLGGGEQQAAIAAPGDEENAPPNVSQRQPDAEEVAQGTTMQEQ